MRLREENPVVSGLWSGIVRNLYVLCCRVRAGVEGDVIRVQALRGSYHTTQSGAGYV